METQDILKIVGLLAAVIPALTQAYETIRNNHKELPIVPLSTLCAQAEADFQGIETTAEAQQV